MDIQSIKFFLRVAETEHMSNAADELNISQPALSNTIKKIEEELGAPLFKREGRNIKLNKYGRLFMPYAKNMVLEYNTARDKINALKHDQEKLVTISMPPMFSFPNLFQHIYEKFPDVSIVLKTEQSLDVQSMLKQNIVDFVVMGSGPMEIDDKDICIQTVSNDRLVLAVPNDHPAAQLKEGRLIDFKDYNFINFTRPSSNSKSNATDFDYYCELAGFSPRVVFQSPYMYEVVNSVRMGIGLALVPIVTAPQYNLDGISIVEVTEPECYTHLNVYYLKKEKERSIVKTLREYIINYFSEWNNE